MNLVEIVVNNIDLLLLPAVLVGLVVLAVHRTVDPLRRYTNGAAATVLTLSLEYLVFLGLAAAPTYGFVTALGVALFFAPQIVLLPLLTFVTSWTVQFEGRGFKHWRPVFLLVTAAIFHFWTRIITGDLGPPNG